MMASRSLRSAVRMVASSTVDEGAGFGALLPEGREEESGGVGLEGNAGGAEGAEVLGGVVSRERAANCLSSSSPLPDAAQNFM